MNKVIGLVLSVSILFISCKAQTSEEKINKVCQKAIQAIKEKNADLFLSLIPSDLENISKDDEGVRYDVEKFNRLFETYLKDKQPKIVITDLYDFLGERLVRITIYNNEYDSTRTDKLYLGDTQKLFLDFYFGPPIFRPLNKMGNYTLVINDEYKGEFKPLSYWKERGKRIN